MTRKFENLKLGIIGLGYVGLPLCVAFSKKFSVMGYDHNNKRIEELNNSYDSTNEISTPELIKQKKKILFTDDPSLLGELNCYIITVPTPIDIYKKPDLSFIKLATETVAKYMKKNDIIIYESTVYPGVTRDVCVPIIEKISGLSFNQDFFCGYSPERINPGDPRRDIASIKKITSGSTTDTAIFIDSLYKKIITAGTYMANSIEVAEAAKVIENTQRDLNIALINELAIIFNLLGINTKEVLDAAETKWNFLPFKPGLVGGHCIGVDPYYLTYKSEISGYSPDLILSGRKINDNMSTYISQMAIKKTIDMGKNIQKCTVNILGFTFKENCNDIRNTKVLDLYNEFKNFGLESFIHDPFVKKEEMYEKYNIENMNWEDLVECDILVLAVPHDIFLKKKLRDIISKTKKNGLIVDIKSILSKKNIAKSGRLYWGL